jgi:DNA recombination protein RmuC
MQLERILEQVGLRQGVHFDTQKHIEQDGVKQKPDFVIHMPNGVNIIIDVKTPMDSYWSYVDAPSDNDGDAHRKQFTSHVRGHVKQLGSKDYFRGFENTPEFVVMFLPSESLYALAIGEDQNIIEDAAKANVILASPTTIMGLLRVIHYGWQQQKVALEAKNIASLAADLYKRLSVFGEHFVGIGSA